MDEHHIRSKMVTVISVICIVLGVTCIGGGLLEYQTGLISSKYVQHLFKPSRFQQTEPMSDDIIKVESNVDSVSESEVIGHEK